jgi:glucose/arabinose dehydrogenase
MTTATQIRRRTLVLIAPAAVLGMASWASAAILPDGFSEFPVTASIASGTRIEFSPDGKLFVLDQAGACEVYEGSGATNWTKLQANFFADTPLNVNTNLGGGLLGIAFDPDYANNRFVYFYYTMEGTPPRNRLERYTANAAGDRALPGSSALLMEFEDLSTASHIGGALRFGPDGKLYVGIGDNLTPANSQLITNRFGKILRLNPDPNNPIPADNPTSIDGIAGTTTGDNRAIWCAGLRNPFSLAFKPGTNEMYINDVGEITWEEINVGAQGANYGWSVTEGPFDEASFPNFTHPIVYYHHSDPNLVHPPPGGFTGRAVTGGVFYVTSNHTFPLDYAGDYFFADNVSDWIRRFDAASNTIHAFAAVTGAPVDLALGPDGALYYLSRSSGRVFRVQTDAPPCFADTVSSRTFQPPPDGAVDGADLAFLLGAWGNNPGSPADIVTSATFQLPPDGVVDGADLAILLGAWGNCN